MGANIDKSEEFVYNERMMKTDVFMMLQRLLSQNEFELLPEDEASGQGDIRLVYQMNDTVESFLVFKNARMTGTYKSDYEGALEASFCRDGENYALIVRQEEEDCVVTILFEKLELEMNLYQYGDIAHFWRKGYEHIRQIEFRIAVLWDKYEYLGEESCNEEERRLVELAYFPPLNYCCYPAVPDKYIVPRDHPWIPSAGAFDLMVEIAEEAQDAQMKRLLAFYKKHPKPAVAKYLAMQLHRNRHAKMIEIVTARVKKATAGYKMRSFGKEADEALEILLQKARKRKQELEKQGIRAEVLREEPFTTAKDTLDLHVYVMQHRKGLINQKVIVEEIY